MRDNSAVLQRAERAVLRKVETEVLKLRDELEAKGVDEASNLSCSDGLLRGAHGCVQRSLGRVPVLH